MKINHLLLCVFLIVPVTLSAQAVDLDDVRRRYYDNEKDSCAAVTLYRELAVGDLDDLPTLLAYRGVAQMMKARCVPRAFEKLRLFRAGRSELEKALSLAPENWEIRFLRFQLQTQIPAFLGYRNFREDISVLMRLLPGEVHQRPDLWVIKRALCFLNTSGEITGPHKKQVRALVEKTKNLSNNRTSACYYESKSK